MPQFDSKRAKRRVFLRPIRSKITLAKKKEKKNTNSEEGEKRRREKSNGSLHPYFYIVYFPSFWPNILLEGQVLFGVSVFRKLAEG